MCPGSAIKKFDDEAQVAACEQEVLDLKNSNENSKTSYLELKNELDGLEKERDFYFDKLRDIEIIIQVLLCIYIFIITNLCMYM
jgi:hypothetical protein